MATFGQKLKEAREEKGLRLEQVSQATRVRLCYLKALERNDFDAMPQDVFVRGFVRMIANCLEVDPDLLVAEYRRERDSQRPTWEEDSPDEVVQEMSRILQAPREVSATDFRRVLKFAGFVVVVLALVGVWWIGAGSRDEARLARAELRAGTPASIDAAQPPPVPSPGATLVRNPQVKPAAQPKPAARTPASSPPAKTVPERTEPKLVAPPPAKLPVEEPPQPKPAARTPAKPEPRSPVPVETAVTPLGDPGPAATPEPEFRPEPTAGRLNITEFGVGTGLRNGRLVGEGDRFTVGTRVWFLTRVVGGKPGETIHHVWKHEGHGSSGVPLTLGGEHWRTQSRKTMWEGSAGRWAVEAVDGDGRVLARREFVCVPQVPSRPL